MLTNNCDHCGKNLMLMDGINTEIEDSQVLLCSLCWNKFISEEMGLDFETIELKPITLKDCRGKQYTFCFFTRMVPSGLSIEACEFIDEKNIGYKFSVLGSFNCNQSDLILDLYEKIKLGLATKCLKNDDNGKRINDMKVVGRIEWDEEWKGEIPMLNIDGEQVTWFEFGKMLMTFEGWQFKMDIVDCTD